MGGAVDLRGGAVFPLLICDCAKAGLAVRLQDAIAKVRHRKGCSGAQTSERIPPGGSVELPDYQGLMEQSPFCAGAREVSARRTAVRQKERTFAMANLWRPFVMAGCYRLSIFSFTFCANFSYVWQCADCGDLIGRCQLKKMLPATSTDFDMTVI